MSVDPETEVEEIIDLLLDLKIGALPVVDEETRELMGIVSYVDVLRALRSRDESLPAANEPSPDGSLTFEKERS